MAGLVLSLPGAASAQTALPQLTIKEPKVVPRPTKPKPRKVVVAPKRSRVAIAPRPIAVRPAHVVGSPGSPVPAAAEVRRYVLSAAVVLAVGGVALAWLGRVPLGPPAAEVDDEVLVDLPPELASSAPRREAPDGPEQDASQAAVAPPPRSAAGSARRWDASRSRDTGSPEGVHGRVDIAFSIDRKGRLVADRVAHTSGSVRLDRIALAVAERAAPFPEPPSPTDAAALSFTIPIVFAHR